MNKIYNCPKIDYSKDEKISFVVKNIFSFLVNEKLLSLIRLNDESFFDELVVAFILKTKDFINSSELIISLDANYKNELFYYLEKIEKFSLMWNYRENQNVLLKNGERARWLLIDNDFSKDNEELIIDCAKENGLIGITELSQNYKNIDYILVLGGGKESNILRPLYSKILVEKYNLNRAIIVGLACDRLIDNSENTEKFNYGNCQTEFDCVAYGFKKAFNRTKNIKYGENIEKIVLDEKYLVDINKKISNDNDRKTINKVLNNEIYVLKAPSTDINRRANSFDTYEYFFKVLYNLNLKNLLLVSSQLFIPYQSLLFMDFVFKYNLYFEMVGYPYILYDETNSYKHATPIKYLQEFRSLIMTSKHFILKYIY